MNASRNYKITVEIVKPMSADRYFERIEVAPDIYAKPIRVTDIPIIGLATGEVMKETAASMRVDREKFVKYLSKQLATSILKTLEGEDTFNGYPQNTEPTRSRGEDS